MEQRAKQLAALTLEDEEEVKKEVREASEVSGNHATVFKSTCFA